MKNKKCPCDMCISLAICRHKTYVNIFYDCVLLRKYIPRQNNIQSRNEDRIYLLQKLLNPTEWEFTLDKKREHAASRYTSRNSSLVFRKDYDKDGNYTLSLNFQKWGVED